MVPASLRYRELRGAVLGIVGDTAENEYALDNLRKGQFPVWRSLIAYIMHKEGYTLTAIGDCIKRNHSTVFYLTKNIESIVSSRLSCYHEVIDAYDKLQECVSHPESARIYNQTVLLVGDIEEALSRNGVEGEKRERIIEQIKHIMYESKN